MAGAVYGAPFIAGADVSHLRFFENRGVGYSDEQGTWDALDLLADRGLNCARLRLFTSTPEQAAADPYNAINNLDYTIPLAVRVKEAGLQLFLDFHYSDTWADPGKQTKPAEWAGLSFLELERTLYEYTRDAMAAFREAGALPDLVQVGNEIIGGFLWPDGRVGGSYDTPAQWSQLRALLRAAIQGVRDGAGGSAPATVIHIDRGADWGATQWFFDRLLQEEVEFDVIGQSYYPFWHGSLNDLRTCLNWTTARYSKPVLLAETAFPWNGAGTVEGIPPTPEGQVAYVAKLAQILRSVPNGRGIGLVWWGAEYVRLADTNLAGFDRRSFFDFDGRVLPVTGVLGQMTAPVCVRPVRTSGGVSLSWPLGGAGMVLTTRPTLASATPWTPIDVAPEWTNDAFAVSLPATNSQSLFRLEAR
jgi:arabinogalactan endo-1,4-beta-galactosidase